MNKEYLFLGIYLPFNKDFVDFTPKPISTDIGKETATL
jgi:hypothetical protein